LKRLDPIAEGSPKSTLAHTHFHFLVRVSGSSETYHYEVLARSPASAKRKAQQIPHLTECRLITEYELADFLKRVTGKNGSESIDCA
jgi:hypothetical protein